MAKIRIDIERLLAHLGAIKLAYSVDELAEITPLSRFYWYQVINVGELEAQKGGEKTVVLLWHLLEFLNALPPYQTAPDKTKRSAKAASLRARRGQSAREFGDFGR